jgi:hypothetical protein
MKKLFLLLIIAVSTVDCIAQIKTTKVASKAENIDITPYDSTRNFLGKDVYKYIGQDLYLNEKPELLRKFGYQWFVLDYTKRSIGDKSNIYKCCDNYYSKYSELAGKYFKVLDVIKHPKATENEDLYGNEFYLKLREKESGDIVYFEYKSKYENAFPFIVVGFFEKLKQIAIGQKFVFGSTDLRFGPKQLDVNTGESIVFELGEKWECVDVTIEEKYYTLSLLLQDNDGQVLCTHYEYTIGEEKIYNVFSEKEADIYKAKFGLSDWNVILQGKVRIGMTKEMCRLSWGEPKDINKTITSGNKSEQWVYSDNYLYFDNDILTAMQ